MLRKRVICGIVCLAVCLLSAPSLAETSGMVGPELRQWIEDPAQGLAALREGRLADLSRAPAVASKAAPAQAAAVLSEKAVEVTFVDPGMEAAVRAALDRPYAPIFDNELLTLGNLNAQGFAIQSVADLQYMPNLQFLTLQNNGISTLDGFPYMDRLHALILDMNQLVSLDGLPSMPWLQYLSAQRNQIGTLADMPALPMLTELHLGNNNIASLDGMPELTNLNRLSLSHNLLEAAAGLPAATYLTSLDLSHNALRSLADMPLFGWLGTLDISFNQLTTAAGLYKETPVHELYANHNQFASLGVIGQLDRLQTLAVGDNQLTSLDGAALNLDLNSLDVSRNRLASLSGVENYPGLRRLNASGNCFKSLSALAELDGLYWLSLVGCGLDSLADFPAMEGLRLLDLSCNQLATLAEMGDTPMLETLDARFNQLQTLDPGFRPSLGYLGAASNGMISLSTLNGANAPYLFMIDVSFNQLASLQGVEKAPSLTAIAARGNQISSLATLSQNPQLSWLDVSSNQLVSFEDLPENPPLMWLNASHNQIASLRGLATAASLYLGRLDVSHNLLTSVTEIAAAHPPFESLDISDNQVSDVTPLEGRKWHEIGLANNPTGDVQSVLFGYGIGPAIVSVGPGQMPSLKPFSWYYGNYYVINANGPEYADLSMLPPFGLKQLRISGVAGANLAGLAKSVKLYGSNVQRLALPDAGLSDITPLSDIRVSWLDVSKNGIADLTPVTSGFLKNTYYVEMPGIQNLDASSNPLASLAPVSGRALYRDHFPPIGAQIFNEYELEQFGMTPEQAHNCLTFDPVVDVTNTPVASSPEVEQLRAEGVKVRTDGTCSYCAGACVPPRPVTVPDVVGMTQEEASAALAAAGLAVGAVTRQCSDTVAAGSVISQNPAAGAVVDEGSGVSQLVSLGPCTVPVTVPNVVGQPVSAAVAAVQAAGLLIGTLTQQHSATIPPGAVMAQNPAAGASVPPGTAVALVISLGTCPAEGEGEPQVPLEERAQALLDGFCEADTDGDRRLSLAEAQAAQPGLTEEEFALLDANGNGELSKRELEDYADGPCGCNGCHDGDPVRNLDELVMLLLGVLGLGLLGNLTRL